MKTVWQPSGLSGSASLEGTYGTTFVAYDPNGSDVTPLWDVSFGYYITSGGIGPPAGSTYYFPIISLIYNSTYSQAFRNPQLAVQSLTGTPEPYALYSPRWIDSVDYPTVTISPQIQTVAIFSIITESFLPSGSGIIPFATGQQNVYYMLDYVKQNIPGF
jgi:hypothetical protein